MYSKIKGYIVKKNFSKQKKLWILKIKVIFSKVPLKLDRNWLNYWISETDTLTAVLLQKIQNRFLSSKTVLFFRETVWILNFSHQNHSQHPWMNLQICISAIQLMRYKNKLQ